MSRSHHIYGFAKPLLSPPPGHSSFLVKPSYHTKPRVYNGRIVNHAANTGTRTNDDDDDDADADYNVFRGGKSRRRRRNKRKTVKQKRQTRRRGWFW